jgi:hypothetical protein|uniref:Uncharacterized protein n=1 Tax=viral metagenome TaxID=1070528 RepID=A0A6C0BAP6_9ZZZZ
MDLNKAFADHWDKKNPSAHVQACDHSRQLMEDAQRERERKQKLAELDKLAQKQSDNSSADKMQFFVYKFLFMDVGNP